ncbi:MAG: hypothetical protein A4S09_11200 [Proteobacteria bacterium SG_bin7]|nr:MAG: hypothetical protein A4S09_11200 [Proteobacteria bacterium SG_bin7]
MTLLLSILLSCLSFEGFGAEDPPFWKTKSEIYRGLVDDRDIVVSVTHKKPKETGGDYNFNYKGAQIVNAPVSFCQKKMLQYENLPKISNYIKEAKFDPDKKELYFHGEAYGFHATMWMKIITVVSDKTFEMHFEVLRGNLVGMKGIVRIEDFKRQKTEMSLAGSRSAQKLGMPAILLDFGLEIVLQRVASTIRNYLEGEYKKER